MIWRSALSVASRGRLSVLIFHRVLRERDPLFPSVPIASDFDALLRHIKSRFNVLPLGEAVTRLYGETLPPRALSITFDDGYADNVDVAAPLLRAHGLTATIFIATGYLDGGVMFNDVVIEAFRACKRAEIDLQRLGLGRHSIGSTAERRAAIDRVLDAVKYLPQPLRERTADEIAAIAEVARPTGLMMSSDGVRALAADRIEIGAHTVNHPILAKMAPRDAWSEIVESKGALEALLGKPVELFAYPNGKPGDDYGAEHVRMVREAGFRAAVSTAWGAASRSSDALQLPRFMPWTREPLKFDLLMLRNLRQRFEQKAA